MNDDELDELICRHLETADGGRAIGFSPYLRVELFVDLLSAALIPEQGVTLARALLSILPETDEALGLVAPKWGNPVLGYRLCETAGLPLLLARDDNLFERWFDGVVDNSLRWVLVDDVASDGERLGELIDRARDQGIRIEDARFIINRLEGDAFEILSSEGLDVHALRHWKDDDLRQLRASWRREGR